MTRATKLPPMDTPTLDEFKTYAFERIRTKYNEPAENYSHWIEDKFEAWTLNGWKKENKGKLVKILNWKTTIIQCMAYRQPNKSGQIKVKHEVIKPGGKLDQMDISDLKSAYNTKGENGYVDIMYFDVFNFLVKKGVINPNNPKYYKQKYMEAGALIMARLIDQKKQLDTSGKMDIDRRLERIKEYNDHEIKPQAQCLVLRDLFKKYTLEQLLNKVQ